MVINVPRRWRIGRCKGIPGRILTANDARRRKGGTTMKIEDAIAQYPGVQGGYPVIAGTRTPIRAIVELYEIYDGDINEIHLDLAHLTLEQIHAALDYYRKQPELVDEDIAGQKEALRKLRTLKVPSER